MQQTKSISQRREEATAKFGWISESGIVVCGDCVRDLGANATRSVQQEVAFRGENWQPFDDADEGFCSRCDKDLKLRKEARR